MGSRYTLKLPELPSAWELIPGTLHWVIEWQEPMGQPQTREVLGDEKIAVFLPNTWTNAVFAWPYWPDLAINPGVFKPAGALFPFDVKGTAISLSWQGGVDVMLYCELGITAAESPPADTSVPRLPVNFNWSRFRELYTDPGVNAEYRLDPWLADWPVIAARIWQSGFDRRRLVPQARQELRVPVEAGFWIGTSPFSEPLFFDNTVPVFRVRTASAAGSPPVDTWVSAKGILRCTTETWFFLEFQVK